MAVKGKPFASATLVALVAAFLFGSVVKPPPVDLRAFGSRLAVGLFADHVRSFSALEALLMVYLASYRGAMQESLLAQPRWIDELRTSGDLEVSSSGSRSRGMTMHGGPGGLRYYIDGNGEFHLVSVPDGGGPGADVVVGFGPLREAMSAVSKKPRSVALIDTGNGTTARVLGGGRRRTGTPERRGQGLEIRLGGVGRIGVSKGFALDGGGIVLTAEYGVFSPGNDVILWGLFVVFSLAILVAAGAGAALFGITIPGGGVMQGAGGGDDIVNEIDREIAGEETSGANSGSRGQEEGGEAPETERTEDAALSIDRELEETEAVPGGAAAAGAHGRAKGASGVLEQDGIKIKKS
jgi:hypothetical protein